METYKEFDSVLLKDGRFASLVHQYGPGTYDATVGDGPQDWEMVYGLTDEDIERKMTKEELEASAKRSEKLLKEFETNEKMRCRNRTDKR